MNVDNFNLALIKLEDAFTNYYNDYSINHPVEVLFLGSQAILFSHKNISNQIINSSYEIDVAILFGNEHKKELSKISDIIDFSYGYGSQLHDNEMFYIDNMTDVENDISITNKFPVNWRTRAKSQICSKNSCLTFTFLDIHDVSILKLIANRDKDIDYVKTLIQGSILEKKTLLEVLFETQAFIDKEHLVSIGRKIKHYFSLPQENILSNKKLKP